MGFSVQTLGTLARVQESPLDEIYLLLMIFIGPLAQSSGKLPRNLTGSCFQLVVKMQRVIKLRKGLAKAKMHLSRFSKSSQTYDCNVFAFFFFLIWGYGILFHQGTLVRASFKQCLEKYSVIHLCVQLYMLYVCTRLYNSEYDPQLSFSCGMKDLLCSWWNFRQTTLLILKAGFWIIHNYR